MATATGSAMAQSFTALGFLPGATASYGYAVSADGLVVVGLSGSPQFQETFRAFRWTSGGGMASLGTLAGGTYSYGNAVSGDGSVVVGYSASPSGVRAFRWTSAGGMMTLGTFPDAGDSRGYGVSADGLVIVGVSDFPGAYDAFRWTSAGGMVDLGTLPGESMSQALGASADAAVVVGISGHFDPPTGTAPYRAFRWTSGGGMQDLGTLPGDTYAVAYAVSADGRVVVGQSEYFSGVRAFRWTSAAGMVSLGVVPGDTDAAAYAVSADGRVVVGQSQSFSGMRAFLWTAALAMVDLNTYLPTLGIDLSGWTLTGANGVSSDGLTIAGYGAHNGATEAWAARLPSVQISAASPPTDDPFTAGAQPFRDVLQNSTTALVARGIGATGTPALAGIDYANPHVTFSATLSPAPLPGNISVSCTDLAGNGPGDCPGVTSVAPGAAANEYVLTLSRVIPSRECTTLTFLGTAPSQKLQYQSLPGDVNRNGTTTGQDVIALALAINSGAAVDPANLPRYDINRNGSVTGQDVVRLVQLLNGGLTVLPPSGYNAATVAACP